MLVFFFYRDGPRLSAFVHSLLHRLIGDRADHYLELVAGTVQRVVNELIGTAAAQAILAYIGFLIAGIPGALVLGLLTFACSFIMVPPLIWGRQSPGWPAGRRYGMAVFLGIWGMFVISGVDNVLKPYLISRAATCRWWWCCSGYSAASGLRLHGTVPRSDATRGRLQSARRLADQGGAADAGP